LYRNGTETLVKKIETVIKLQDAEMKFFFNRNCQVMYDIRQNRQRKCTKYLFI